MGQVTVCDLTAAGKRELVQRVAASPVFTGSRTLQAFLLFITEHEIAGNPQLIKEQRIGCEVLGRRPDYDPADDNIVRVRARELRRRLATYFSTAGVSEPVVITVPSGSYVPVFSPRAAAVAPSLVPGAVAAPSAVRELWGQFFPEPGDELRVVASDAAFALWQDITGQSLNLGDYLGRKFLDSGDPSLREVAARRCVAPADLTIALNLAAVSNAFGGRVRSHFARNLGMQELRSGNAVLLGSRRSNPWVQLFEARLNFVLANPSEGGPRFENRRPLTGEPASFAIPCRLDVEGAERTEMESYAVITLTPNLSNTGHVILLQGLNMEATEAAGEFVTNPEELADLLSRIGHVSGSPVRPFEALLKLTSIPGGYANTQVIAWR
ncbi:MAG TPA: hypothetical protein VHA11_14880 [Bryobacteraceae bacterium]|nr:hypothetical protein [Bryobacteraceae bacterium]